VKTETRRAAGTPQLPATLTEAQRQSGLVLALGSFSSARVITYADRYRASNGILETPIQYIQKAAEDESKRRTAR
jgi:hypothetical protein